MKCLWLSLAIMLAACGQGQEVDVPVENETPAVSEPKQTYTTQIDPFYLMIEAERWQVMIENASSVFYAENEGLRPSDNNVVHRLSRTEEGFEYHVRADSALRNGVTGFVHLRRSYCEKENDSENCFPFELPEWMASETSPNLDLSTLQMRSDWLGETIQPLVDAICSNPSGDWRDECKVE